MRRASILLLLSMAAACLLLACAPQSTGRGRGGRDGMSPVGRGGAAEVGRGGLGRGGRGAGNLAGVEMRKYRFEETGEMIEYAVFVSSKAKKDTTAIPLVIALHGRGAQPTNIMGLVRDGAERAGFIVAAPMGYNTQGWYGLQDAGRVRKEREYSEKDVMNVLGFMRAEFNIDSTRIYVMGTSMGGAGALYLAAKYPNLWAAVGAGAPAIRRGAVDYSSIRHMPVFLAHGDRDGAVSVEVSRSIFGKMKELGMTVEYREIPGGGHPQAREIGAPWIIQFFERLGKSGAHAGGSR